MHATRKCESYFAHIFSNTLLSFFLSRYYELIDTIRLFSATLNFVSWSYLFPSILLRPFCTSATNFFIRVSFFTGVGSTFWSLTGIPTASSYPTFFLLNFSVEATALYKPIPVQKSPLCTALLLKELLWKMLAKPCPASEHFPWPLLNRAQRKCEESEPFSSLHSLTTEPYVSEFRLLVVVSFYWTIQEATSKKKKNLHTRTCNWRILAYIRFSPSCWHSLGISLAHKCKLLWIGQQLFRLWRCGG